jgi:hypothetical protein
VCRDWEFVSKGTEISLGKFVSEYFTPLTLDSQSGVVSTEDTDEIWKTTKEEAMEKVKGKANRTGKRRRSFSWSSKGPPTMGSPTSRTCGG